MNINKIECAVIILAGGQSQRAETVKGLRQIDGQYWIDLQIKYFKEMNISKIFVGLGYDNQKYLSLSKQLKSVNYIINPSPENGSFSTLQTSLKEALKKNWGKILLMHVDHALPNCATLMPLLKTNQFEVVKPVVNNISGHPIVLNRTFCNKLIEKPSNSQLNLIIRKLKATQVSWVNVDDASILENFNSIEDWQKYLT